MHPALRASLALPLFASLLWLMPLPEPARARAAAAPLPTYTTEVTVEPSPKRAGAFLCKAVVRELGSAAVVAAPALVFSPGDEATAESSAEGVGPVVVLRVKVVAGSSAEYTLTLRHGQEEQTLHRGRVVLG
ncbi:MAG TPA: hypothetical protein PK413_09600 [Thermoanaerobaculia bacterium]|nr:hypothetical protein [Thermoanaerobaculia bacterium]